MDLRLHGLRAVVSGGAKGIGRAAAFLASPAASFIMAANLVVDGALTRGVQL